MDCVILAVKAATNTESEGCNVYRCYECGNIFEIPKTWEEDRSQFWGMPCRERLSGCPECGGSYDEVCECAICGMDHAEDEMYNGICEDCIESCKHDVDTCYLVGENCKETVELNCFLTSMFTNKEIETILYGWLKQRNKVKELDCSDFIDNDRYWFAENLSKYKGDGHGSII